MPWVYQSQSQPRRGLPATNTMELNSAPQVCRWPFKPFWNLEGFDFTQSAQFDLDRSAKRALYKREFTTAPSDSDLSWAQSRPHSLCVCNNVTVQFQAMLYCRDSYATPDFWHRVQQYSNRQGKKTAEAIGDLFIAARKAYLQGGGRCLNGAVRAVDEWIAFLESAPPGQTQREIRYGNWIRMKERDVLQDAGRPFPQQSEAMRVAPLPQVPSGPEARHQYPSAPSEWRDHPNYDHIPAIKRDSARSSRESPDENANRPDNVSSIGLGPPRPAIFTPRQSKRKRVESLTLAR